ncbi:MAG TPA: hypothetical protein VGI63_00940 [Verrucomicrobiae bacterium]|jgi:hypothetical protein
MISLPEYKVMGDDGNEYGPVYAEQIVAWIAEERLEKKSPVKPPGAKDWVFLGSLPEFAESFDKAALVPPHPAQRRARKRFLMLATILLAGFILLALKILALNQFKTH